MPATCLKKKAGMDTTKGWKSYVMIKTTKQETQSLSLYIQFCIVIMLHLMFVLFRKRTPALSDAGRDKGSSQAEFAPPSGHTEKRECS